MTDALVPPGHPLYSAPDRGSPSDASSRWLDHALRAAFLGPGAAQAGVLHELATEAIDRHVAWRQAIATEPASGTWGPAAARDARADDAVADDASAAMARRLHRELTRLLDALEEGVPFHSPRYVGHMLGEQTIAAQLGAFAAMLFNPNNVSVEASPVTTRLEHAVGRQLARMVGYDPARAWGHLTAGGTVANFEALWIARSAFYLPVAVQRAARVLGVSLTVRDARGGEGALGDADLWTLLNLTVPDTLTLRDALDAAVGEAAAHAALEAHALQRVGYQEYARRLAADHGDPLPPSVVLVAATAHYSWDKIVRALGIGSRQLVRVPVDARARVDADALHATVERLAAGRVPIMACVSVCGTTEEGAVDRLDAILAARDAVARTHGVTFHVHSDACYGGYATSALRAPDGATRPYDAVRADGAGVWPSEEVYAGLAALAGADSITVDPHKWGYVPYGAGAILLRDRRARDLIAADPPYLAPARSVGLRSAEDVALGRYILEGSRPGAAAASVWLSHQVVPPDATGYGALVARCAVSAHHLHAALGADRLQVDGRAIRFVTLPAPDLAIVCFVAVPADHDDDARGPHGTARLAAVNALNERIYTALSHPADGGRAPAYLTRTTLRAPDADAIVLPLLGAIDVEPAAWCAAGDDGLVVLRATMMDPWFAATSDAPSIGALLQAIREAAASTDR